MITFTKKSDHKGLGYEGEARLETSASAPKPLLLIEPPDYGPLAGAKSRKQKQKPAHKKTGFGVGILNDTGSDDEDPYEMGPKISYNRIIGPEKKAKKSEVIRPAAKSANPLVKGRPVFVSKSASKRAPASTKRTCHDGRLPLPGFILATAFLSLTDAPAFPPPKIPPGWKSSRQPAASESAPSTYQSVTDEVKASSLDPKARAALLGEAALPGKSVFDYLKPEARARLASASGKSNLPQARGEAPPEGFRKSPADAQKDLWSLVPALSKEIAVATLAKGAGGWMPYADDEGKRARYISFLELRARTSDRLPERNPDATVSEWVKELEEFVHAAQVFKPITGLMASRFTSSKSGTQPASSANGGGESLLHTPAPKPTDPAEEAAKMGMYGPMTRTVQQFFPTRLLCKRFGVKPPPHVQMDPGAAPGDEAAASSVGRTQEPVSRASIEEMMRDAALHNPNVNMGMGLMSGEGGEGMRAPMFREKEAVVDVERNEALEGERAGEAVFKAIFGSDDEDDDD
jgi:G patch domain-containing protein 1